MRYLYRNAHLISPDQNMDTRANLVVNDGIIEFVGQSEPDGTFDHVVEMSHLMIAPGFFDMHVHLREPGQTHKETIETGCAAAINGGFTGLVCMPNTDPSIDSIPILEYIQSRAAKTSVDVYCCATITRGRQGTELANLKSLLGAGAIMFSDDGSCLSSAEMMRRAFDYIADVDGLLTQHCEEHSMTHNFDMHEGLVSATLGLKGYPSVAEDIIVARDILLADYCGNRRYHVAHMSTKGSVRLVREAKLRGQRISCEVTPHHFVLTDRAVGNFDTNAKMNPPLREESDVQAIIDGLTDGTIDCIATDHAPHSHHEKHVEFSKAPNGIIGLETAIGLTYTYLIKRHSIELSAMVRWLSSNPRKVLHLPIPVIAPGEPANLTLVDLDAEWTVNPAEFRTKSKNTPFGGWPLYGRPFATWNKGRYTMSSL